MVILIIILSLISVIVICYLVKQIKEELKKPEPKQFSKEEIKKRPGIYFDGRKI